MADIFSAESRLIHAGTERAVGQSATPPLVPASAYVSQGIPRPGRGYGRDGNPGWEAIEQALGGLASSRLILPATSFGGVESTWERRARWPAETAPPGLIRLSVGVEPATDLITDIDQALEVL